MSAIPAMAAIPVILEPNVDTSSPHRDTSQIMAVCPPPRHASDKVLPQPVSPQEPMNKRFTKTIFDISYA